ncbi:hypothetical protein FN846DRAFT_902825 [Sphaerosporella brunnea]|uniref:Uncharacterized protein n=1 Tax=Sphaerosporella brunnea TaxID=1250544 RepID=A0A5J5F9Y0_9PEZI|nr:hypothetical protein FN846DRAFT_914867 [Sphaerosporella brunnea]KAA8913540.1 hypothetical protein FN846DRAFT_902825 [Sphaerosporella brunnea]
MFAEPTQAEDEEEEEEEEEKEVEEQELKNGMDDEYGEISGLSSPPTSNVEELHR